MSFSTILEEEGSSETELKEADVDEGILTEEELFKQKGKAEKEPIEVVEEVEDLLEETRAMNATSPSGKCESKLAGV